MSKISILDIFKIGIGPSSSHTVGPMKIANKFIADMECEKIRPVRIVAELHGSLSSTGIGHNTDRAVVLGLAGFEPETIDIDTIPDFISKVRQTKKLPLNTGTENINFDWDSDILFLPENLPLHENGMTLTAHAPDGRVFSKTYYSIGGGFYRSAEDFFIKTPAPENAKESDVSIPFPYENASELLTACAKTALSVSGVIMRNEYALHGKDAVESHFSMVWKVMQESVARGMNTEGLLPGSLRVPRRAISLQRRLQSFDSLSHDPMNIIDWVNMFAFSVAEENAAGGRVVTAPTNGACGIIPAVLAYYNKFVFAVTPELYGRYFLTSGGIGALYKMNASISGAEVGCQGEIGVACSMAAAGLAELLGASPPQVCSAAEIAMEHNLGLTCDPVDGLVQVPCIERNAIMAVKAINATRMALLRTTKPCVSLDKVIQTMYETGKDMNAKYRETAQGGLAKNLK